MPLQVWMWKDSNSQWPDIYQLVEGADAQEAVFVVMHAHGLSYAYYAWVSPVDGHDGDHFYHVDCPAPLGAGRSVERGA